MRLIVSYLAYIDPSRAILQITETFSLHFRVRTRRQRGLRPSHQGQEKAEDEKFAHKQMLVRNEAFGIHHAGGFG
ncbi:MAG: hypothetical protein EBU75_03770 [Betaproteobacteria bacterium]|jgi:hypothetical protein|nr:hypothetical protein [Betaproteobacteria bacterium]